MPAYPKRNRLKEKCINCWKYVIASTVDYDSLFYGEKLSVIIS